MSAAGKSVLEMGRFFKLTFLGETAATAGAATAMRARESFIFIVCFYCRLVDVDAVADCKLRL